LSWHLSLQAVVFFIAKFFTHQLVQNATHFGDAAAARVTVMGVLIATIETAITASARLRAIFCIPLLARPHQLNL
jgi:hypothetical protein